MIKIDDISLKYGSKDIFNHLNLSIEKGEKVLLNMGSGSGKTTLLKLIMGFKQPDSGTILIGSDELNKESITQLRQKFAYLPQSVSFQKGRVEDIIQNVFSYHANKHLSYKKREVLNLLAGLHLEESILQRNTTELSGGEKQRIGIVLMRLLKREYYLLDEITSALNTELKEIIRDYFISLPNTVIIVSHDEVWNMDDIRKVRW